MNTESSPPSRLSTAEHHLAAARLLEVAAHEHRCAAGAQDVETVTMHALLAYGHRVLATRHAEIVEVAETVGDDPIGGVLRAVAFPPSPSGRGAGGAYADNDGAPRETGKGRVRG